MTLKQIVLKAKKELLASQVSRIASDTNENLLKVNLTKFFTDLEHEIQSALMEYWSDTMLLQGQINLIVASIHEKHQEYYELIMRHKLQEFRRAKKQGERLVKRANRVALKSAQPVQLKHSPNNLFGTLKYTEDKLANNTFTASENTLNRVDSNIQQILTEGYRSGEGINEVSRQITERFDQLRTWEANRIARTEIHTAQNMGIMSSYEDLGVEYTQWIAASDDRTRESHLEIDREIIPIGSTYSNGLEYPGDTSGPIEEWINCRCSNAPFVIPYGYMAPSFSPFREDDLIPIETSNPLEVTEPQPVEPTTYNLNSNPNSKTEIQITQAQFDNVIAHQAKRANNKLEFGNVIENETGRLVHSKDIKGKKNTVKIPTHDKPYSVLHNHTNNGGFSGTDVSSHLENRYQEVCYATTPQGVWIMRDTPQTTYDKQSYGVHSNTSSQIMYAFNGHYRTISKEIYDTKYKERFAKIKDRKEYNKLKDEYANECFEAHNKWILENYGHGKNENIEIEFIPKERLKHVKF